MVGLDKAIFLGRDEVCEIKLSWWSPEGEKVDLDLAANLYDGTGGLLGIVDGRLDADAKNVSEQWETCGIRHFGDTKASQHGEEVLSIDLTAASHSLVASIMAVVRVRTPERFLAHLETATLTLRQSKKDIECIRLRDAASTQVALSLVLAKSEKEEAWTAVYSGGSQGFMAIPSAKVELPEECVHKVLEFTRWKQQESIIQQHELGGDLKVAQQLLEKLVNEVVEKGGDENYSMHLLSMGERLSSKLSTGTGASHSASSSSSPAVAVGAPPARGGGGAATSSTATSSASPPDKTVTRAAEVQPKPKAKAASAASSQRSVFEPPPRSLTGMLPFRPRAGPTKGGLKISWQGDDEPPWGVDIGGRPCAALENGVYVVPKGSEGPQPVTIVTEEGKRHLCTDTFSYWKPGEFVSVKPARVPLTGGRQVTITTSDLGAPIVEVVFDSMAGVVSEGASSSTAVVTVPAVDSEGYARVEVRAENGNVATSDSEAFFLYEPETFGVCGDRIELQEERRKATRRTGTITGGVCIGAYPLRRCPEGRYFEVCIREMNESRSTKTGAFGMMLKPPEDIVVREGQLRGSIEEARQLPRVWLLGYDNRGLLFINDGNEVKMPSATWRPVRDIKEEGTKIGVLWTEGPEPELVIYQDGQEKVRSELGGLLPKPDDALYAVVDVQGCIKGIELLEGASPPQPAEAGAEDASAEA
mmetsp:Transcript_18016/g.42097  ORF Transcript_18016/g.42097 Transcript_18016/m.42097 type:complete len:701 (-) Transcript_18016:74-2176(-)